MISEKVFEKAKELDSKRGGVSDLRHYLEVLQMTGSVEVGWRQACGASDPTQKTYREWLKLVKMLKKEGVELKEEP